METSHQFCEKCGAANRATSRFCRYCGNLLIFKPNDRLRAARENKHISREQVATQIGTSKLNIGRWERGDASPHSSFIEKLCELFEKTEEELGLKYYNDVEEQGYCESVIKQLTPRQLEVLQAFARGLHPSGVADLLSISAPTVSTHTTVLLGLCRNTWSIEARNRLDYRFLQHKFGRYLQNYDAGEIVKASDGDEDRVL